MIEDLLFALAIVAHYALCVVGCFAFLRKHFKFSVSLAVAIPLAQAAISFIYQSAFLSGLSALYPVFALGLASYSAWTLRKQRTLLAVDLKVLTQFGRTRRLSSSLIGILLLFSLAQVFWLAPKNHDALTYHLPRVFLFLQQETLLLSAFSRYHQAIFPVGSDILFLPFVQLGTMLGMGIFSLSSYVALGAASYALARRYADQGIALASAFIVVSLPMLALQSVSVKNDILMAGAGAAALLLTTQSANRQRFDINCLLLVVICSYGISCKTTFIAFLPGLALLFLAQTQIRNLSALKQIGANLIKNWFSLGLVAAIGLVLSQIWLFAWNAKTHESWSGPESFTHRHQQHDGLKGTAANAVRYGIQMAQAGPWTDQVLPGQLGLEPITEQINGFYSSTLEPILGESGASRESFEVNWRLHEDWTWFGPVGALIVFALLPIAIARKPRVVIELIPALLYFFLICALVSWMPWNGRFFTLFFVAITPAVAVAISGKPRWMTGGLIVFSVLSLLSTKLFDFARPTLPIGQTIYEQKVTNPMEILGKALKTPNVWSAEHRTKELHFGDPSTLLKDLEAGASVGIFIEGHFRHFGFYHARPDINWLPLNYFSDVEPLELTDAWKVFLTSEMDYLLCAGIYSSDFDSLLIKSSGDGTAKLIAHPRHALGIDP